MYTLPRQLLDLCLLRVGPQELPGDARLPLWLALAYVLVGGIVLSAENGFGEGMAQAALDAALLAVFVLSILRVRERPQRFNQTYAALMGINLVIALVSWPLLVISTDQVAATLSPAQMGLLAVLVWNLIAQGQVLRSALDTSAGVGLLLAFVYFLLTSLLLVALFPGEAPVT
ncbi:MAG: hypothetical protein AB1479_02170 [Pseudomonadota bacterium]